MERRSDVWSCSLCQRNIMRAEVDRGRCDKEQNPHDATVSLHTFPDYHSPMYVRGERVAIPLVRRAKLGGFVQGDASEPTHLFAQSNVALTRPRRQTAGPFVRRYLRGVR